jgi:hypothetical protein
MMIKPNFYECYFLINSKVRQRIARQIPYPFKPKAQRSTLAKQAQPAPAAKPKRVIAQAQATIKPSDLSSPPPSPRHIADPEQSATFPKHSPQWCNNQIPHSLCP